jgi:hypothetical protein
VEAVQRRLGFFQAIQRVLLGLDDVLEGAAAAEVEVTRVALVVAEEAACPVGVALPGAVLTEAGSGDLAEQVEQSRWLGRWSEE